MTVRHTYLSVSKAFPLSPGHIFGDAPTLLLRKAGHDGDQQFTLGVQGVDVFLLEIDLHTFFFQLSDSSEAVHGVTSEAADGFCDDEVHLNVVYDTK